MNYYTIQEICDSLKVSDETVLRVIKSGQLPAAKIGKQWRISEFDFNNWFKARKTAAKKELTEQQKAIAWSEYEYQMRELNREDNY